MERIASIGTLAASLFLGLGCGGSPIEGQVSELGTFEAVITGFETIDLEGFATSNTSGGSLPGWGLQLITTASQSITILTEAGTRPTPGTYPIVLFETLGTGAPVDQYIASMILVLPDRYVSISGTVEIDSSSATQVRGSFTFTAELFTDPVRKITVDGSFFARNTDF